MLTEETARAAGLEWGYCHGCGRRGAVQNKAATVEAFRKRNQCACKKDFKAAPPPADL